MKKTHKDLLEWLGLKVGDEIRFNDSPNKWIVNETHLELDPKVDRYIEGGFKIVDQFPIIHLIEMEFNILPKPKRVGDLKCKELGCIACPLRVLSYCGKRKEQGDTLYKILNYWNNEYPNFDQEIHDLLKARLDKEVLEDEKN